MASLFRCEAITKEFTKKKGQVFIALQNLSLDFESGTLTAIVGPSGSGKSTLLSVLAGLDRPSQGKVFFEDEVISNRHEQQLSRWRRENVGFVFQTWELIPTLTAMENVCMPLLPSKKWTRTIRRSASLLLRNVGLADKMHDFPPRLSGGEQQRIALARALVTDPRLILADEPTGNIDAEAAQMILQLLREEANNGKTVVLVTHDENAAKCADRTVHILGGRLV